MDERFDDTVVPASNGEPEDAAPSVAESASDVTENAPGSPAGEASCTPVEETVEVIEENGEEEPGPVKEAKEPSLADYLEMTIQSCVLPLEMRFSQINGAYQKLAKAYRSHTFINSVIEGVIPPEKYSFAADQTDRGVRLTKWNIKGAIDAIRAFQKAGRKVDFVTARVSPRIIDEEDIFAFIKSVFDENGFTEPERICLEFPKTALYEDFDKLRTALLSLKLLRVRSLISGFGAYDSAVTPLFYLPFDYVILDSRITAFADDNNLANAFGSLISFIRDAGCMVIAEGAKNDSELSVLSRSDCYGYIPSPSYEGEAEHGSLRMTIDEAVLQEGGEVED
ncbi:MAG: EAL domain-containing protein [Clostridia bacterium]|nr:EAL domain-containing protein [Clostridia bacterium]